MQKLNEFGIHGDINSSSLSALTDQQAAELRKKMGVRGFTLLEASEVKDAKGKLCRAKAMRYEDVEDRYRPDATFCDRIHEDGRALLTASIATCLRSPTFLICLDQDSRYLISAGVAANAEHQRLLTKLTYFSQPNAVEGFPYEYRQTWTKVWGFMFGHTSFQRKKIQNVKKDRSHRSLLT
jgi:hypothetical protein